MDSWRSLENQSISTQRHLSDLQWLVLSVPSAPRLSAVCASASLQRSASSERTARRRHCRWSRWWATELWLYQLGLTWKIHGNITWYKFMGTFIQNIYICTGWWFGTFVFHIIGNKNPNWLICFQKGWNHQPDNTCLYIIRNDWDERQ